MMRPSTRRSLCSYSHIWIFCRLCRNLKIRFCKQRMGWGRRARQRSAEGQALSAAAAAHLNPASRLLLSTTYDGLRHDPLDLGRHGCWLQGRRGWNKGSATAHAATAKSAAARTAQTRRRRAAACGIAAAGSA